MTVKMKVPKLRFPEFEGEWEIKKVEQVLKRVGKPVNVEKDQEYHQIGIRSHGKGLFYKELVTGEELGGKRVFWVVPDSFIVNIVFAWEQAVAKTTFFEEGMIASHRFPMFQSQEKHPVALDFVLHFFLTKKGKVILEAASPGGAGRNKTLGQKEFERQKIFYPTLPEQQKIATFLTTINTRIQQLSRKKALLEQYKKGVMQQLFSQEIRFKDEKGKEFPAWKMEEFGKIAKKSKEKYDPSKSNKSFPCIELESLSQGTGILLEFFDSKNQKSIKNKFRTGEVLFGKLRPYLRKFLIAPFEGVCSSEIWVLIGTAIINDFLYWMVQTDKFSYATSITSGSKMPRADWDYISGSPFRYPSKKEQQKIAAFLSTIDHQINLVSQQLKQIQTFKKGLLQQMFV